MSEQEVMNKQGNREEDIQTEPLADLALTGAQAEQTKAGGRHEGAFIGNLFSSPPVTR